MALRAIADEGEGVVLEVVLLSVSYLALCGATSSFE